MSYFNFLVLLIGVTICSAKYSGENRPVHVDFGNGLHPPAKSAEGEYSMGSDAQERCYGELGCLTLNSTWYHRVYRPVNFFPENRTVVGVQFFLRTRNGENKDQGTKINSNDTGSLTKASFDGAKPVKFIIHGFTDSGAAKWVKQAATELLKVEDCNVVIVDWGKGSVPPYYQATANTRLVGLEITYLIKKMQEQFKTTPSQIHLIGHSLGAQTAGYVGQATPGIARITGLDPCGPYFIHTDPIVRLDPSDAEFVDAIHTDGDPSKFSFGMSQPVGHLDFYPNGGYKQPGCKWNSLAVDLLTTSGDVQDQARIAFSCDHQRAVDYFIDSISNSCPYLAYECDSYEKYVKGKCGLCCNRNTDKWAYMGYRADQYPHQNRRLVQMYLTTNKTNTSPNGFCSYDYIVKIKLALPEGQDRFVRGSLGLRLNGKNRSEEFKHITGKDEAIQLEHGKTYTFLLKSGTYLGNITDIEVDWRGPTCIFMCGKGKTLFIRKIDIAHYVNATEPAGNQKSVRDGALLQSFCNSTQEQVVVPSRQKNSEPSGIKLSPSEYCY